MIAIRYKTILFDLDGTLIDSWPQILQAIQQVHMSQYPGQSQQHLKELWRYCHDVKQCYTKAFPQTEVLEQLIASVRELYQNHYVNQTKLYSGVTTALSHLQQLKINWGIVTSKPKRFTMPLLQTITELKEAKVIICPEDVTQTKPNPEGLFKAMQHLKAQPESTLYVGDAYTDILAANNAGVDAACALYGYCDQQEALSWPATFHINALTELTKPIKR